MTRSESLANRSSEVLLNGKWIANTNIKERIESITWKQAIHKVESLNTIAALTFHIDYYLGGLNAVFKGGDLTISDKYSFDLPEIDSESDWNKLRKQYYNNAEEFVTHVKALKEEQLDQFFVKETYGTYQRNVEGVIEHSYYHLGQISLICKLYAMKKLRILKM